MPNTRVVYRTSEIRRMARVVLKGNWLKIILGLCIIVFLESIPLSILQGIMNVDFYNFYNEMMEMPLPYAYTMQNDFGAIFAPMAIYSTYSLLISGPLALGLCMFMLNYLRTKNAKYDLLLSGFTYLGKAIGLHIITMLLIFLGAIMFIIPAIIFGLAISMCFYILADNRDMGVLKIIGYSWRIMSGNKLKLFGLYLSFLGWLLLTAIVLSSFTYLISILETDLPVMGGYVITAITFIISTLIIVPVQAYMTASEAIFYEMVSGRIPSGPVFISVDGQGRYWQGPYGNGFHGQWGPPPYDPRQQGQPGQYQDQGQRQVPPPYDPRQQSQPGQYQDQGQGQVPPPFDPRQQGQLGQYQDQGQGQVPPPFDPRQQGQPGQYQDQGLRQSSPPYDGVPPNPPNSPDQQSGGGEKDQPPK